MIETNKDILSLELTNEDFKHDIKVSESDLSNKMQAAKEKKKEHVRLCFLSFLESCCNFFKKVPEH
jgi:hypothetical protein